ncbi:MAG: T9SS type A sorting domain-containing protein, partial [Methanothrix sp.]|nr:T9SS type A sorting domain-containing protein [Methanothrix sp.]
SEIYYARFRSDTVVDSTKKLAGGFRPQIHIDNADVLHLFWLQADSSNGVYYKLMVSKAVGGSFETPTVLSDSVRAASLGGQFYETPIFDSFVDDSGRGYAGWTESVNYGTSLITLVIVAADGVLSVDSLTVYNTSGSRATFFVEGNGTRHVLWSTYSDPTGWTLHYSRGSSTHRLFEAERIFRSPSGYIGNPHLFMDSRDTICTVFSAYPSAIGFVRNLWNGPDSIIRISPGASIADGIQYGWGRVQFGDAVAIDAEDQVWIVASHNGPALIKLERSLTGIRSKADPGPLEFTLSQNYPNPFNPSTAIQFVLPQRSRVRLTIFNLLGQQVSELANEDMVSGSHERIWNPNVASGMYFYRIEAVSVSDPSKRFVDVKKLLFLK